MKRRYVVRKCDNTWSTDGKQVTWDVVDMHGGREGAGMCVANYDTRKAARKEAEARNAES